MNLNIKLNLEEYESFIVEYLEIKYNIKLKKLLKPSRYDIIKDKIELVNLYDFILRKYEFIEPTKVSDIEKFNKLLLEHNYIRLKNDKI